MLSDLLPPELWVLILDNLPVKVLLRTQREPYLNLVVRNHLYEKLQRWAVGLVETNEIRKRIANDRKLKQKIRSNSMYYNNGTYYSGGYIMMKQPEATFRRVLEISNMRLFKSKSEKDNLNDIAQDKRTKKLSKLARRSRNRRKK